MRCGFIFVERSLSLIRALWTAASGMRAQQMNVDMIANNLANVNTTGFKKTRIDFQDLFYQTIRAPGAPVAQGTQTPNGLQVGHGVRSAGTKKLFIQGNPIATQQKYDLMIEGDGFFQVLGADGTTIYYTRDGAFQPDSQGQLVTVDGFRLADNITIPSDTLDTIVSKDGTISVITSGSPVPQSIGQITLARFVNPAGLENIGRNLYAETNASGQASTGTPASQGFGIMNQGFLELSNVEVVEEMVRMITAQRAYEANSRAILTSDDMLATANQLRR